MSAKNRSVSLAYSNELQCLSNQLTAKAWQFTDWDDGPVCWRYFRAPGDPAPQQGWKIHLSAAAVECSRLLAVVSPVLREGKASFKLPRRLDDVVYLNSGDGGTSQLGKIVTVYPGDDRHAASLLRRLDAVWRDSRGPEVSTDLHVRPGSAVSFRYGVYGAGPVVTTSTGTYHFAWMRLDGSRVADVRSSSGPAVAEWPPPPIPGFPPCCSPVKLGEPHATPEGKRYLPLQRLGVTSRAETFLAADLEAVETLVLRVGRPGVLGRADGTDLRDRFHREFQLLQVLAARTAAVPRPLAFHDLRWPMLACEDVRGRLLSELPTVERVAALPRLAEALAEVHAVGIVHGDVKLENAVWHEGQVRLLDFELAEVQGEPMRRAGTPGHLPPEAEDGRPAEFARDVYALAGSLLQAVLGVPPGLLPPGIGRWVAVLHQEGEPEAAHLVRRFAAADPRKRPTAQSAVEWLEEFARRYAMRTVARDRDAASYFRRDRNQLRRWALRGAREAGELAGSYAKRDGAGLCWRNTHAQRYFDCEEINLGAAGIVLGLLTLDTAAGRSDFQASISHGAEWLAGRPSAGRAAGLFTGNAGVALALAVVGSRLRRADLLAAARERFTAAAGDARETDLFSGAAGVIWTGCLLHAILEEPWPLEAARAGLRRLRARKCEREEVPYWTLNPAGDTCYLGSAHGSAGVALALGSFGRAAGERGLVEEAIDTFARIHRHGRTPAGDALRMTAAEARHHAVGNWCHGVAGYLWCLLQGVGDHPALQSEIDWSVKRLSEAPSLGTPTYCHGLAGQLELWQMLTGLPRYRMQALERARRCAQALRHLHHRQAGRTAWISDNPDVVTPDLWVGFLGPAAALAIFAHGSPAALLSTVWLRRCAEGRPAADLHFSPGEPS